MLPTVLLTKNFSQLTPSIQRSLFSQRIIWILWWQGLSRSPLIVQKSFESWKAYHDTSFSTLQKKIIPWQIVELNRTNIQQFVNLSHYLPDIRNYSMGLAHQSDLIRMILLREYGGVWVDATLLCNLPLDFWLPQSSNGTGFFVFSHPRSSSLLSNWFIYSTKSNYMIEKWLENYLYYWKINQRALHYFNHHETFTITYQLDKQVREMFEQMFDLSAKKPHILLYSQGLNQLQIIKILNESWIPVFKLTYRNLTKTLDNINRLNISHVIHTIKIAKPFRNRMISLV
eukprot:gene7652-8264_t